MGTLAEMDHWVAAEGIDQLRLAIQPGGRFNGTNRTLAIAWLEREADRDRAAQVEVNRGLALRNVAAAEASAEQTKRSADAAVDSARSARRSYWVSVVALLVAIVAVVVAVWFK